MYETYFGMHTRPFPSVPSTGQYFAAPAIEQARVTLARLVDRAEGVGLVTGPAGTGKSLLCQLLAEQFRERFAVALLSSTRLCSRRALLQNILFELKLPYRGLEEGELRLSLIDFLEPGERCPNGMLLLVDEAHTLPLRLLEEIRMITNLVRAGQPRVRLVLAGSSQLEERLASPKLESFQQRIAGRCYLDALSQLETAQYIRHQLGVAGGDAGRLFTESALRAVFSSTGGVPRLINQLCDHALILACAGGVDRISDAGVEEAWADLQRLPAPRSTVESTGSESSFIEFSVLDDEQPEATPTQHDTRVEQSFEWSNSVHVIETPGVDQAELETPEVAVEYEQWDLDEFAQTPTPAAVPVAVDPFGGSFEDEEVVIERFADWHLLPTIATSPSARWKLEVVDDFEEPGGQYAESYDSGPTQVEVIDSSADESTSVESSPREPWTNGSSSSESWGNDSSRNESWDNQSWDNESWAHESTPLTSSSPESSSSEPSLHESSQAEPTPFDLSATGPSSDVLSDRFEQEEIVGETAYDEGELNEDRLAASVEELREEAQRAATQPLRVVTPVTNDLLAIWSQPVFAGSYGDTDQNCWTNDVLPTGQMSTERLLSELRRT